jgi:KDO II ethanolaminephosphotransferase
MIVWASDKYLADPTNQSAFERLKAQQRVGKTHRHVELFDTLLGCLGYTSPDGGINQKNNWCADPKQATVPTDNKA